MKAVVACLVLLAALAASQTAAAPRFQQSRTFIAVAVPHRIETHLPPPGRTGDRDLLRWTIRDRHGNEFGTATLDCNWSGSRQCVGVFRLARGSFAVSGAGQTRSFGEFLVVGGTGDYATAHGPLVYNATVKGKLILTGSF